MTLTYTMSEEIVSDKEVEKNCIPEANPVPSDRHWISDKVPTNVVYLEPGSGHLAAIENIVYLVGIENEQCLTK